MKFCKFCGNALDDDAVFCSKCGAQIALQANVVAEDVSTQKQGTENSGDSQYINFELVQDSAIEGNDSSSDIVENNNSDSSNINLEADEVAEKNAREEIPIRTINKKDSVLKRNVLGVLISSFVFAFLGVFIFLSVVIASCIKYDGLYFIGGYYDGEFLVASIFSVFFMLLSIVLYITWLIVITVYKKKYQYMTKLLFKIVAIIMIIICFAFSLWTLIGLNDGYYNNNSNNNWGNNNNNGGSTGGGGSTYFSFYDVYTKCDCAYPWADWGSSYLTIDTNPYDYDSDSPSSTRYLIVADTAIKKINSELGFPSYVYQDMIKTRAIDGRQTYYGKKFSASWRYHPDSGLEITYTKSDD